MPVKNTFLLANIFFVGAMLAEGWIAYFLAAATIYWAIIDLRADFNTRAKQDEARDDNK